ncbi:MAG TPA: hypothetical protein VF407_05730, partial [Polyangiaceae bacterium]
GGSADPVFTYAWELGDTMVGKLDTACTGASLPRDAGGDCASAFQSCAGGVLFAQPELGALFACH